MAFGEWLIAIGHAELVEALNTLNLEPQII
jgi:hypothetical protein